MARITRTAEIGAPVERVYAFMGEPTNLPAIWPSMVDVSSVERHDDGGTSFDWVYKMAGIRIEGHADTVQVEKNRRVVVKNATGIPSTFVYTYDAMGGDRTRFSMDVDYDVPSNVLGKMAKPILRRINEREADTLVKNLKARMERGERARPEPRPHA